MEPDETLVPVRLSASVAGLGAAGDVVVVEWSDPHVQRALAVGLAVVDGDPFEPFDDDVDATADDGG